MADGAIEATMLLCDSAQSVGGKLYVLGGGWDQLHTRTPHAMALAVKLEIPDEYASRRLEVHARLVRLDSDMPVADSDGNAIDLRGSFEVKRRPGQDPQVPLSAVFAMNVQIQGLTLDPGGYVWQLFIADEPAATATFRVLGERQPPAE